ncbi:MAG: transposase [Bacilli bacterium]|jgi:transposase-like protein|nr:transposase [Bacilli bacterium]
MGRKRKFNKEIMLQAISDYKLGKKSITQMANDLACSRKTVEHWVNSFDFLGEVALIESNHNRTYSKELKKQVISDYLNGKDSLVNLTYKYKISSHSIVRNWIFNYNSGIEIQDYDPKYEVYTMKARKTTLEERIEIVEYCLANKQNYKLAVDKYSVPYSLVYQWVRRYLKDGSTALGYSKKGPHNKVIFPTTDQERFQMENERLKRELERKELEIEILKKKQYFAELLYSPKSNKKNRT